MLYRLFVIMVVCAAVTGCASNYVVRQPDGTVRSASFVEVHSAQVRKSISVNLCPEGMSEVSEVSAYSDHNVTLDTDRGRRYNNYYRYDRYSNHYRESPVRETAAVGGRKRVRCY